MKRYHTLPSNGNNLQVRDWAFSQRFDDLKNGQIVIVDYTNKYYPNIVRVISNDYYFNNAGDVSALLNENQQFASLVVKPTDRIGSGYVRLHCS